MTRKKVETPEEVEQRRAYHRAYTQKHKARLLVQKRASTYGLSVSEMNELLAGGCGICGTLTDLHIDHDHETGKVRGILCRKHNVGLGHFDDDPDMLRRAIQWLESH